MPDEPLVASFRAVNAAVADRLSLSMDMTRKFPTYAPPFYRLALLQQTAGDTATALRTIQEYLRLAPNHPNAHDAYADMLARTGRLEEALSHYERAVELDRTFMTAYTGMAGAHVLMKKYPEAISDMQRALAVDPTFAPGYQISGSAHLAMGHPEQTRASFLAGAEKASTPAAKVAPLSASALMYVPMGKPKSAVAELITLATNFEQQNLRAQAAASYRNAALIDAALGDQKAVAGHLAKAVELTPTAAPNAPPVVGAAPHRFAALAYALNGQLELARTSGAQFAQAIAAGNAAQQNNNRELKAIIAIGDKNLDLAKQELAQAGPGATLGKAMLAEALKKSGKRAEAKALKEEILSANPVPTVFDVIARAKAQKI
jgi:tetratricopeptide (TPR) repeat protein